MTSQFFDPRWLNKYHRCCVPGCKNSQQNSPHLEFYRFPSASKTHPHKLLRRTTWINILQLHNPNGSAWMPKDQSRICSEHFVGNKKSDDPRSPSYNPSIFAGFYNRERTAQPSTHNPSDSHHKGISLQGESSTMQIKSEDPKGQILHAPNNAINDYSHPELMVNDPDIQRIQEMFFYNRNIASANYNAQMPMYMPPANDRMRITFPKEEKDDFVSSFNGYSSIKSEQEIMDLAGVSSKTFNLLLKMVSGSSIYKDNRRKMSNENRLLLFLMKMKCGLTFSTLSALFDLHRSNASRNFYSILDCLSETCKNFVFWPNKDVVEQTMPTVFKPEYSKCRVIIDSTNFAVEQLSTNIHREQYFSQCHRDYRIKNIIGYSPCGLICHVSKCHGGQATDDQVTISSGLLDFLEPDDVVLSNKELPQVRALLYERRRSTLLVMPPLSYNQHCSEEADRMYKMRYHIEKMMQRIYTYKIIDKFTAEMLPHCDKIIFMCCVLVNLQAPMIQDKLD